jgi:hypothetical protein
MISARPAGRVALPGPCSRTATEPVRDEAQGEEASRHRPAAPAPKTDTENIELSK